MSALTELARDQTCVRCGGTHGVVLAHYFGPRRSHYGGGMGIKGHDLIGAHLCQACHTLMDTTSKDKEGRWLHSEEFLHYVAMTLIRLYEQGRLVIGKGNC